MKIKGVTKRGKNTYRFTLSLGFDGNGNNIRKTRTFKVPDWARASAEVISSIITKNKFGSVSSLSRFSNSSAGAQSYFSKP